MKLDRNTSATAYGCNFGSASQSRTEVAAVAGGPAGLLPSRGVLSAPNGCLSSRNSQTPTKPQYQSQARLPPPPRQSPTNPSGKSRAEVPGWAQDAYRQESKREVVCSMSPDKKIGSIYFENSSRIRLTHAAGPMRSQGTAIRRFNVDEALMVREFNSELPPENINPEIYNELLQGWVAEKLGSGGSNHIPAWAVLVDKPSAAYDFSKGPLPSNIRALEVTVGNNLLSNTMHWSRGVAVKLDTDKQTISVLEAALKKVDQNDFARTSERNEVFYQFVAATVPNFKKFLMKPSEIK